MKFYRRLVIIQNMTSIKTNILYFYPFFQVYKRKNEAAKKDYLKALAEYRAGKISQVSKTDMARYVVA